MEKHNLGCEIMEKFNLTNLSSKIKRGIGDKRNQKAVRYEVRNHILSRINILTQKAQYFIFEESYVETEWKDMISVHYINTSYHTNNIVMRVHLFSREEFSSEYYLGFFTLRTIDEISYMLSFIYPNWKNLKFLNNTYVMTYNKKVHIAGKTLDMDTYPILVQDNMVISCAQAALLSMSKYLHNKYDYKCIRILDINQNYLYGAKKAFPAKGLDALQMLEILRNYNIGVDYNVINKKDLPRYQQYIEYTIESALPVLFGVVFENDGEIVRHVIQIIGHQNVGKNKKYVILDDSGCLLNALNGTRDFVAVISLEEIFSIMQGESNFIIYPIFDRVYTLYDDIKVNIQNFMEYKDFEEVFETIKNEDARCFLADNTRIKEHIAKAGITYDKSMPHYMWCYEMKLEGDFFICFIMNPTYHAKTTKMIIEVVCITNEQITLLDKI